jgi:hypothetical protein
MIASLVTYSNNIFYFFIYLISYDMPFMCLFLIFLDQGKLQEIFMDFIFQNRVFQEGTKGSKNLKISSRETLKYF